MWRKSQRREQETDESEMCKEVKPIQEWVIEITSVINTSWYHQDYVRYCEDYTSQLFTRKRRQEHLSSGSYPLLVKNCPWVINSLTPQATYAWMPDKFPQVSQYEYPKVESKNVWGSWGNAYCQFTPTWTWLL